MERARATWTDERLDDLAHRVSDGFNRVDRRFDSVEARLDARFDSLAASTDGRFDSLAARTDGRFDSLAASTGGRFDSLEARIDARFDSLERRIDGLQRLMIQFGGATMVAVLATLLSVLATRA